MQISYPSRKPLCRKEPGDPGGYQVEHDSTRDKWHQIEHKMFYLIIKEHFFTLGVTALAQVFQGGAKIYSLEIFTSNLDIVLGDLL